MAMANPMFAIRINRIIFDRSDSSTVEAAAAAAGSSDTAMSGCVSSTAGVAAGSEDGAASPSFPSQEGCWSAMILLNNVFVSSAIATPMRMWPFASFSTQHAPLSRKQARAGVARFAPHRHTATPHPAICTLCHVMSKWILAPLLLTFSCCDCSDDAFCVLPFCHNDCMHCTPSHRQPTLKAPEN